MDFSRIFPKKDISNGFTLIELLVIVGVVSTLMFIASATFMNIMRGSVKTEIVKEVKQNGDYAINVLERMIRNASDVSSGCIGLATESLTIITSDSETVTFSCIQANDTGRIASASATTTNYLTNDDVSLGLPCPGSLSFVCTAPVDSPKVVAVSFTLSQAESNADQHEQASVNFKTTVSLRNQ